MSRTVKEKVQQQTVSLLDFETAKNKNFALLASRPQRPGMTTPLKKVLADCFKTLADGPKTGMLAARAISRVRILKFCNRIGSEIFSQTPYPIRIRNLKLWSPISNPNPKPPTQLHISENIW